MSFLDQHCPGRHIGAVQHLRSHKKAAEELRLMKAAKALIGFYEDNTVIAGGRSASSNQSAPTSHSGQHFQPRFRHQIQQR